MILVSVIVPVYKVEEYLEACVQSIRRQTYQNLEIILVDDGSPDCCGKMCDQYAEEDGRIVVLHKENGGLGDARNTGVKRAKGKYLLFVDSDDRIHENLVQSTVQKAEAMDAEIVLFDYVAVTPEGTGKEVFSCAVCPDRILSSGTEPELVMCSCSAVNKLYRTDYWRKNQFLFPSDRYYEDLGTIPKVMAMAERIVYLKEILYKYTMREGSIMHSHNFSKNYEDRTWVLDDVLEFYQKKGLYGRYERELEYLVIENGYFVPSKELILNNRKSEYLKRFREYAYSRFPLLDKNPYIKRFSRKDRVLWALLQKKLYGVMICLSYARRGKDYILKRTRGKNGKDFDNNSASL